MGQVCLTYVMPSLHKYYMLTSWLASDILVCPAFQKRVLLSRQHGGGVPEHWGRDSPYHPGTSFLGTPPDHLEVRAGVLQTPPNPTSRAFRRPTNTHLHLLLQIVSWLVQRVKKRPVSPHVFEADGTKFHYAMPINAITSIMNRATGVALTVGEPSLSWGLDWRHSRCATLYKVHSSISKVLLMHLPNSSLHRFLAMYAGMTGAGAIALTGDLPATIEAIKHTSPILLYPIKAAVAFPLLYHYLGGLRHVFWDKAKYGNQVPHALAQDHECCGLMTILMSCHAVA